MMASNFAAGRKGQHASGHEVMLHANSIAIIRGGAIIAFHINSAAIKDMKQVLQSCMLDMSNTALLSCTTTLSI